MKILFILMWKEQTVLMLQSMSETVDRTPRVHKMNEESCQILRELLSSKLLMQMYLNMFL